MGSINQFGKLENHAAKFLNVDHCFSFASGRMGFFAILKSLSKPPDSEIIIPAFTCVVVPNAILYAGFKPVYSDISLFDFNIDPISVESLINDNTIAIYVQHTFGQSANINKLKKIAEKYGLLVIEDVALSLGAKHERKYLGTIGDFGYFSMDRSKVINTGIGGLVCVNNPKYLDSFQSTAYNAKELPWIIRKKIQFTFFLNTLFYHPKIYWIGKFLASILNVVNFSFYLSDEPIHNSKGLGSLPYPYPAKFPHEMNLIAKTQFDRLELNLLSRKSKAIYYNNILKVYTSEYMQRETNIFLRYSFLVRNREFWEERFSKVIDLSIWFKSIASGKDDSLVDIGYVLGSCPNGEFATRHIFNLPTHGWIDEEKLGLLLNELYLSGDIILLGEF